MKSRDRSIGVEKWAKSISGDVSAGLAKNGVASSGIKLPMVGNCQGLLSEEGPILRNLTWLPDCL